MTTQTLSKPRPGGAGAAQSASVAPPEKVFPGKTKLAGALADYQKASQVLSESQAHLSRSEVDEQSALNSAELSDEESADRVAVAQRSISIYRARVASREAAVSKLLKEVKAALPAARNEYANLCLNEREKRSAIIKTRIIEAGRLVDNIPGVLDALLNYSTPIQTINALDIPSQSVLFLDTAEQVTGIAKRILEGYEAIAAKQKEQI